MYNFRDIGENKVFPIMVDSLFNSGTEEAGRRSGSNKVFMMLGKCLHKSMSYKSEVQMPTGAILCNLGSKFLFKN